MTYPISGHRYTPCSIRPQELRSFSAHFCLRSFKPVQAGVARERKNVIGIGRGPGKTDYDGNDEVGWPGLQIW